MLSSYVSQCYICAQTITDIYAGLDFTRVHTSCTYCFCMLMSHIVFLNRAYSCLALLESKCISHVDRLGVLEQSVIQKETNQDGLSTTKPSA